MLSKNSVRKLYLELRLYFKQVGKVKNPRDFHRGNLDLYGALERHPFIQLILNESLETMSQDLGVSKPKGVVEFPEIHIGDSRFDIIRTGTHEEDDPGSAIRIMCREHNELQKWVEYNFVRRT